MMRGIAEFDAIVRRSRSLQRAIRRSRRMRQKYQREQKPRTRRPLRVHA